MFPNQLTRGFTLFEGIIAFALVVIMAVAIVPPLVKNINEGKVVRAQRDVRVIGDAVLAFYRDTGRWPIQDDSDDPPELVRLVGNASLGGGNNGLPDGNNNRSDNWKNRGRVGSLTKQLILNESEDGRIRPLYPTSSNPQRQKGWNGPYLDEVPLDPWGNPYAVNIHYTRMDRPNYTRHNVMVLSAGPNRVFETSFTDNEYAEAFGGDDIGYNIRKSNEHWPAIPPQARGRTPEAGN